MDTNSKGDIAELSVAKRLTELGYVVSFPFADSCRYDLVVDYGGEIKRVQVKWGRVDDNRIKFECQPSNPTGSGHNRKSYTSDDIDAFMVYCGVTDEVYEVPVEDAGSRAMWLRLSEDSLSKYASEEQINWAEEYIVE